MPQKYLTEYEIYNAYCLLSEYKENDPMEYKDAIKNTEWNITIEKEL